MSIFTGCGAVIALVLAGGWHHWYNENYRAGLNVLAQAKSFMDVPPPQGTDESGQLQLPLLNPVRDATLAYGDWGDEAGLLIWACIREARWPICGADLPASAGAALSSLAVQRVDEGPE
jgi:type VI protein secretion system component VasK